MTINSSPSAPARRRIQLLYVGDATLARECFGRPGGSIEVTAAVHGVDGQLNFNRPDGNSYDILLIEHGQPSVDALAILGQVRARGLQVPVIVVADWNEELAARALSLGASDYVVKNRASFRAVYFRLHRLIAHAAAARTESSDRAADRDRKELRNKLSEAEKAREDAERRLREAVAATKEARQGRLTDAVAAAKEHAQRESEFVARTADANATARTLEQQVRDQGAILSLIEGRTARAEQIAAVAARRQGEIESTLREESAKRRSVETQLGHVNEALRDAERQRSADAAAFADQLSQRQAEFNSNLAEVTSTRELFDKRLQEAMATAQQARDQRVAEASASAEREAALLVQLQSANADRERLERRLLDAGSALQSAEQRVIAAHQAGQQRLTERQGEFDAEFARQRATIDTLRQEISALKQGLQESEDRRISDEASAAVRFNDVHAEYGAHIAAAEASRDALQVRLEDVQRALEQQRLEFEVERQRDQEGYASLLADAAAQFADAQDTAEHRLAEAAEATALVEGSLRESETAREHADRQHASEMAEAIASLANQQRQTETWLIDASAVANTLENHLSDVSAQLTRLREDTSREREAAFKRASAQQAEFEVRLAEEMATRGILEEDLRQIRSALEAAVARHAAEIAVANARLADSEERANARLFQAETAIKVAESKRAEAVAALNRVVQQATAERQAAAAEAAERQAQFKADLTREVARREAIEGEFAETRTSAEQSRRDFHQALADAQSRARDERTQVEERTAKEHAEWERIGRATAERIRDLNEQLERAHQALARAEDQMSRLSTELDEQRAESERRQRAADRDISHLRAERDTLQQSLDHTRATADEILTRVTQDRSIERARLEAIVADLGMQLHEQVERMHASEQAASTRLADAEHRLNEMRAAKDRANDAIAQLENRLRTTGNELDAARTRGELLRATAERLPVLEKEIDDVRAETRRQFEENPASWFRCRRSGEIIHANRAMRSLLGYEPLELQRFDFGKMVFDSANDFRWILDRCLASLSTQSIETPWTRKDGRRVIVRVIAVPATADSVDLIAEDITHVRELEEKLRNAQRMESVARYGSEVAVTCQGLLNDVKEEGQAWLAGIESDTVRYRGELLLDDVIRATAYLGQLAAYTEEQENIPDLVDVNKVLRDLEPVLKRVAGENIDVVLPKASAAINLDVEPRPVERMLVNVAAYGRERMPLGGRLKIEVDSVVVDREFVSKHPHVRPGDHVLLIVNEQRRVVRQDSVDADATGTGSSHASTFSGDSPGVDLGALQALVSECGGHLWMRAEPPGDMELKIHLPRRVLDRSSEPPAPAVPSGRTRWIRRAFGARQ